MNQNQAPSIERDLGIQAPVILTAEEFLRISDMNVENISDADKKFLEKLGIVPNSGDLLIQVEDTVCIINTDLRDFGTCRRLEIEDEDPPKAEVEVDVASAIGVLVGHQALANTVEVSAEKPKLDIERIEVVKSRISGLKYVIDRLVQDTPFQDDVWNLIGFNLFDMGSAISEYRTIDPESNIPNELEEACVNIRNQINIDSYNYGKPNPAIYEPLLTKILGLIR